MRKIISIAMMVLLLASVVLMAGYQENFAVEKSKIATASLNFASHYSGVYLVSWSLWVSGLWPAIVTERESATSDS